MNKPHVGFCGLGLMGSGMARRLLLNGFPLTVYNRNPDKTKPLQAEGAQVGTSPRQAAAQADLIISMVADDPASRSVWLGETGALAGARAGTVCIESSTLTVNWVRELAGAASSRNCQLLDAPVTGSKTHAAAGELNFLVGGAAAALETARPVLAVLSKTMVHLGPTGSGALLKLINNFLCGVQVASLAEAMTLIERSGLDRARSLEILTAGAPGSPLVRTVAGRMTAPDFTPNFPLRLMAKDLGYALEEGDKMAIHLITAKAALAQFQRAIAAGLGDQDIAAVLKPFRES